MKKVVGPPQTPREEQQAPGEPTAQEQALAQKNLPEVSAFAEWLAYRLAQAPPQEVGQVLAAIFPDPDQLECHYLASALRLIEESRYCEREVGCGVDFVFWGLEYPARNMASARQWLATADAALGQH